VKRYACKYCKKYRGSNGFKRKDHLTQHLRNYHHIGERIPSESYLGWSCNHEDCDSYRAGACAERSSGKETLYFQDPAFRNESDYNTHMRKVHNETPFPCPISSCGRIGPKGYLRKRDMIKHLQKEHGEVLRASNSGEEYWF
jgi:hypothetical protein